MNEQTDLWINEQIKRHYEEALKLYKPNQIVGVFCQGSQNYGLGLKNSDIDTKCILTPNLKDICFNKKPISTTHILDNNEHLDAKDVRLYINCFKKHNLNFMEILFTDYKIINPLYREEWNMLIANRELIAKANPYRAVKAMKGVAMEKYHAMEHRYPAKAHLIDTYGWDPKQLHHLIRINNFLFKFINQHPYQDCLIPEEEKAKELINLKVNGQNCYTLEQARVVADEVKRRIEVRCDEFCAKVEDKQNPDIDKLFETFLYQVIKKSIINELDIGELK